MKKQIFTVGALFHSRNMMLTDMETCEMNDADKKLLAKHNEDVRVDIHAMVREYRRSRPPLLTNFEVSRILSDLIAELSAFEELNDRHIKVLIDAAAMIRHTEQEKGKSKCYY
jgi:hypothetical protein